MDSVLNDLQLRGDCRTPLVIREEDVPTEITAAQFVQEVAASMGSHVDFFHCDLEDDQHRANRRIDSTIRDGDWLVLSFTPGFPVDVYLRHIGRMMMTLMPDNEKRPNLELFRLWLVLPVGTIQPMLFQQVAIGISPSSVADAERAAAENAQAEETKPLIVPRPAVESDLVNAGGSETAAGDENLCDRKVGPLFHRRLELSAGTMPQNSISASATLESRATRRAQSATPLRAIGASASAKLAETPTQVKTTTTPSLQEREADKLFEDQCVQVIQSLHGALLRSRAFDRNAGERMLRHLQALARTPELAQNDGVPGGDANDLELGDMLLRTDEGTQLRSGMWRLMPVMVEQMTIAHCDNAAAHLLTLRFALRHPYLLTPLALVKERDYGYLISEMPQGGPLIAQLRSFGAEQEAVPLDVVVRVARCVCVALLHLHKEGYLHRDLVAANVFDAGDGTFRLNLTNRCQRMDANGMCGTDNVPVRWMSPDVLTTPNYREADDIWSFGVFMWEVMSGARAAPFSQVLHKDDVAAMLLRGNRLQCPPDADATFWDRVVAPCFARNDFRPSLPHIFSNIEAFSLSNTTSTVL